MANNNNSSGDGRGGAAPLLCGLDAARTRFLEQQCLLSELEGMLHEAQCSSSSSSGRDADQHHPLALPEEAAASLARHMQAAAVIQRLQLPEGGGAQATAPKGGFGALKTAAAAADTTSSSDAASSDTALTDQLGSRQHVLGVTPQQLRQACLPSRKAAQKAHAPLMLFLQQRLAQQAGAAVSAITGVPADEQGPGAGQEALAAICGKQQELAALRRGNAAAAQQLAQHALGFVGELDAIHSLLQQLLGSCVLQEQPKIGAVTRKHQEANLQQLISKLQVMQLSIRGDAYDAKNVAALTAIRSELDALEQQLQASTEQVECELSAYTQLGDEFHAVVQEYGDVLAKTSELDRVAARFASIEDEAAALFA